LAAGDGSEFAGVVGRVAEAMRNGATLAEALTGEAGTFDPFFCALVASPDGRDQLRAVLARLGEVPNDESDRVLAKDQFEAQ
jgi:type II secretory pathway component PulF